MTASTQRKMGVFLQYGQMAVHAVISIVYTPIMLRILGSTEYGIYNLASSIIGYLSLLSLGFGGSYLRFYSRLKKNDDSDGIKRLNGLYLTVFLIMGLIVFAAGFFISSNIKVFYNNSYSTKEIEIARTLSFILTINLAISFPASVFVSYITSQEKFVFQKVLNMGKSIISPITCIIFLYLGYGSIGMVLCTTFLSLIIDAINIYYCFSHCKMKVSFKNMEWSLLKSIAVFSFFIAINQIIDQINWQTDKIILGKMMTGTAVAVYAIGSILNNLFTQFSIAISGVFSPKVNMIVSKNEENADRQLTSLFIRVGRIQWFVLFLILSGFVFFGKYFIFEWAGPGYEKSYYVAVLLMAPAIIPLIQNVGIEIQTAKNKHQFRSLVYFAMALINVGISIIFCSLWGEIGTALGTTIALLVANGLIMNIYYYKKLNINTIEFWKSIVSTFPSLFIPIFAGILLMNFYSFNSLIDFVLIVIGYTILYCLCIYYIGFNKEEKNMVRVFINKRFKRV